MRAIAEKLIYFSPEVVAFILLILLMVLHKG